MSNRAEQVLETYDIHSPYFYEAFVDHKSLKLDWTYFCNAHHEDLSILNLRTAIKERNAGSEIFAKQENASDISKDEFMSKYYKCCEFLLVKDWIRFMWLEHNILITRKDLFTWVSSNHPPKQLSSTDFDRVLFDE